MNARRSTSGMMAGNGPAALLLAYENNTLNNLACLRRAPLLEGLGDDFCRRLRLLPAVGSTRNVWDESIR
jgi:hypothetical protein